MRRLSHLLLLIPALLTAPAACGLVEPRDDEERITLFVGPQTADCIGFVPQKCLLVSEGPGLQWRYFYDEIRGFVHEPGFVYTLHVARRHVPDPPADGSSYRYRLIRVLAKEPAPAG